MAMPFLNHSETPLNLQKLKKKPKKSNLNSFWAFLLSSLVYISVFYVFNLSPSSLLCTTKFWFIISNTLILILAADFGASKDHDLFNEYEKYKVEPKINAAPSYEMVLYVRNDEKPTPKYRTLQVGEEPQEKIISMITKDEGTCKPTQLQVLAPSLPTTKHSENDQETGETKPDHDTFPTHEKLKEKLEERKREQFRKRRTRTMSAVGEAAGKMVLQRTLSERHEEPAPRSEENEFSKMSDEELNRRVEEFIRRCNRQIRLEGSVGTNRREG